MAHPHPPTRSLFRRVSPAACIIAVALTSGCSDLGKPAPGQAQGELSSTALDFGTVLVGQSATRTLTLRNVGTVSLSGLAALTGAGYAFISGGGGFSVGPGGQLAIQIRFTPSTSGSFPATLDLGPQSPLVTIEGRGAQQQPGAEATVDSASIEFGFVSQGQTATSSFQIHSTGSAPVIIDVISTVPDVQITSGGGPGTLDPGASRTVTIAFTPVEGGRIVGEIAVGPDLPSVALHGVGITVSFARDVYPILTGCSCHTSAPRFLAADAPSTWALLVNKISDGYRPALRVKPFDIAQSVLYGKISDSGQFGQSMPPGSLLPAHDRSVIRSWILEGALNN